ncbi:hypothetical protein [Nonomuraea roseoviolacea]|uniref:Uncharacterized protein n=1 Tax=Nonomuraea roseoviolacea subsp. carminata TaxID=160689 RepID=A0ABT1K9F8_9ACTN|nr:hypothetical protein [Nonomuraea roseoviolacea]MCP2350645.1 hypothetical protein [Nonomuraea roseoviolacea subsp. carminata]
MPDLATVNARIQALADHLGREGHPTHDHLCPDDVRRDLLAVLDGQDLPGMVTVARDDLDLVMNHAGDPTAIADYPAAAQRIRDALEGDQHG